MTPREDKAFLLLIVVVSLAFAWILLPFYEAILWGAAIAILFAPVNQRLTARMRNRRTLAALATVLLVLVIVVLPVTVLGALLAQEATSLYAKVESGEVNPARLLQQVIDALPAWVTSLLEGAGLSDLRGLQERVTAGLMKGSQAVATRALSVGQDTFQFLLSLSVMLYLLFFLLRDGDKLGRSIKAALPLHRAHQRELAERFAVVIRATVKGNIVVALMQGALGGLIFWILGLHGPVLWGALMAVLSLLPAVGAGLVWLPVALYLLATGSVWQGTVLITFGVLVIGLVDNFMRPILVGKDTGMPDYVVLISTLGGIAAFGISGFLIGPLIAAMFMAAWSLFASERDAGSS